MNIYPLEGDLITGEIDWCKSAKSYDNYRIISGAVQTTQLICNVFHKNGFKTLFNPYGLNHPNTLWASESYSNFCNILALCNGIFNEYTFRFGKIHKGQDIVTELTNDLEKVKFANKESTKYVSLVPDEYKSENPIIACRNYYLSKEKIRYPKNRIPKWFEEQRELPYQVLK